MIQPRVPGKILQQITNNGNITTNRITIANLNLANIPSYVTQDSATKHGLVNGDLFKLPPDGMGNSRLAIVDTLLPDGFNFTVDNSGGETHPGFQIASSDSIPFSMSVDWGDGNSDLYNPQANHVCTHTYSTNSVFTIKVLVSDVSIPTLLAIDNDFSESGNQMTSISHVANLTHLAKLYLEWNRLPAVLMDTMKLPTGLTDLALAGNSLGSYNPINLPVTLSYIDLRYNGLTTLPVNNLPAGLKFCNFNNNSLSSSEVNNILVHFNNSSIVNGQLFLIGQTPAAAPGSDGISAKNSLELKNWEVSTD